MQSDRERRELEARARYLRNDGRHPLLRYGTTSVDKADSMHHAACGSERKKNLAMCMRRIMICVIEDKCMVIAVNRQILFLQAMS